MSVHISLCSACGHRVFPARLWCPACGHDRMHSAPVQAAQIQAWTVAPAQGSAPPAVVATVRALPDGPVLVVRLEAAPLRIGQRVDLFERSIERSMQGQPLPWGRVLPD